MHNILSAIFGWSQLSNINFPSSVHTHTMWWTVKNLPPKSSTHLEKIWRCKLLSHTPWKHDSTNILHSAFWASEADRSSSETEDEEVEAGQWSEKETERNSRWGGVIFRTQCVCVWVYVALLWSVFPAGMAVSNRPLHCFVSNAMHKER